MCCARAVNVLALPLQRPHGYKHTHELLLTHSRTLGGTLALAATALLAASAAAAAAAATATVDLATAAATLAAATLTATATLAAAAALAATATLAAAAATLTAAAVAVATPAVIAVVSVFQGAREPGETREREGGKMSMSITLTSCRSLLVLVVSCQKNVSVLLMYTHGHPKDGGGGQTHRSLYSYK